MQRKRTSTFSTFINNSLFTKKLLPLIRSMPLNSMKFKLMYNNWGRRRGVGWGEIRWWGSEKWGRVLGPGVDQQPFESRFKGRLRFKFMFTQILVIWLCSGGLYLSSFQVVAVFKNQLWQYKNMMNWMQIEGFWLVRRWQCVRRPSIGGYLGVL